MKNISYDKYFKYGDGMKQGITDLCYGFFNTLANPTRLAIIQLLDEGPKSVSEIINALGQEQSMISHNLRPLVNCKLVNARREGKQRIYRLNKKTLDPIINALEDHSNSFCGGGASCPVKNRSISRKES